MKRVNKAKKELTKPEIVEVIQDLSQEQLNRFQILFNKKKISQWLLPLSLTGLLVYTVVASILLNPSLSWLIVLIPTLFIVFFSRSLFKGVVGESESQHKDYGLIVLPLVLVGMFGFFGALIWSYSDNIRQHEQYVEDYTECQAEFGDTLPDDEEKQSNPDFKDCAYILGERRHQEELDQHEHDQSQAFRGIIVSGLSLVVIYPLALYYAKTLADKRNDLLAKQLAEQVKKSSSK